MEIKPSGNITFLFTDIEGSTRLSQEFPQTLSAALEIHNKILYDSVESNNGFVFKDTGDGICAAFGNAVDAVKAAVDIQLKLSAEEWKDVVIKVRTGIHSGSAKWNGKSYMGYITLARTARVMSAAYGEQIIISNDAYELISESSTLRPNPPRRNEDTKPENKNLVSLCLGGDNTICFRDLGERRLKDVIKPIKLYQINAPGLREDFPPLKTLDARPNNLPVQLTSFIGREKELKQVKNLLSETHLLTLTGTGGAGKSRLSLQAGADVIDDYANGVWFVELASVSEPKILIQTVMSAIGILENSKETPEVTLTGYLRDKEILIILDNCEHMIDACAELAEKLLTNCPNLKILSTSREALKCEGEQIYKIPSLSCPGHDCKDTPEQLNQYESVELFIERALAVNTKFRVTNENAPALAEICSRLDGIPLAIELAAARTKILTIEKIYERLDDRFSLLTGGKRTALPRQQTLRSLIDWSYDLLTESEKKLWNRLSVFRGGWTLEAAEEICSDEVLDKFEIIELLQNLSEKSIIIFDNLKDRYRMLETIREYGDERFRSSDDYSNISKKHLKYYTELAEIADLKLQGPEIVKWLKILDEEKGNMEKGLLYSGESGEKESEVRLTGSMGDYWDIRGQISEGILRIEKVLLNKPEKMNSGYNKILFLIGLFSFRKGEIEKAKKFLNECHVQYVKLNDRSGIASVLSCLGNISMFEGEYDKATVLLEQSLVINRNSGDKRGIAFSLSVLGNINLYKGEYEKATGYCEESLAINREIGDKRRIGDTLNNLGNINFFKREYDKALEIFEESLSIRRNIGDKRGISACLINLGNPYYYKREYNKANEFYEKSMAINSEIGDKIGIAASLNGLGNVSVKTGEYDKAKDYFEKSLKIERDIGDKKGISNTLISLGNVSYFKEEYDKGTDYYNESLAINREIGNKRGIANSLYGLGIISRCKGENGKAQEFYHESLSYYKVLGSKEEISEILLRLIELLLNSKSENSLAKLLGFVNDYCKLNKFNFDEPEQKFFNESVLKLKEDMGEEEFMKSFEEGKSMTLDEAVESIINY